MSDSLLREQEPGRRGEILDAAAGVFGERGYDAGSMREIASRVGVTEPALYRHFPGKQALFVALIRAVGCRARAEAFALIDAIQPGTVRTQIIDAFVNRRRAFEFYAPVLRTVFSAVARNPAFLTEFREQMVLPVRERLTAKAAQLDESFGVKDAEETRDERVRAVMALFVGYFATSIVLADEPDEAIADAALRVMGWTPADGRPGVSAGD